MESFRPTSAPCPEPCNAGTLCADAHRLALVPSVLLLDARDPPARAPVSRREGWGGEWNDLFGEQIFTSSVNLCSVFLE